MRESDVTEQGHSGRHPHLRGDVNGEGHAGGADMHHVRTRSCGERWTRERCKPHLLEFYLRQEYPSSKPAPRPATPC